MSEEKTDRGPGLGQSTEGSSCKLTGSRCQTLVAEMSRMYDEGVEGACLHIERNIAVLRRSHPQAKRDENPGERKMREAAEAAEKRAKIEQKILTAADYARAGNAASQQTQAAPTPDYSVANQSLSGIDRQLSEAYRRGILVGRNQAQPYSSTCEAIYDKAKADGDAAGYLRGFNDGNRFGPGVHGKHGSSIAARTAEVYHNAKAEGERIGRASTSEWYAALDRANKDLSERVSAARARIAELERKLSELRAEVTDKAETIVAQNIAYDCPESRLATATALLRTVYSPEYIDKALRIPNPTVPK